MIEHISFYNNETFKNCRDIEDCFMTYFGIINDCQRIDINQKGVIAVYFPERYTEPLQHSFTFRKNSENQVFTYVSNIPKERYNGTLFEDSKYKDKLSEKQLKTVTGETFDVYAGVNCYNLNFDECFALISFIYSFKKHNEKLPPIEAFYFLWTNYKHLLVTDDDYSLIHFKSINDILNTKKSHFDKEIMELFELNFSY